MYAEMIDDPKVGSLNDAEFRSWVSLLCLAAKSDRDGDTGITKDDLDWVLRRDVTVTLPSLLQKQLVIETDVKTLKIKNWDKWQKQSDTSSERTRKYRERLKEKNGNVTATSRKRDSDGLDKRRIEKKIQKETFVLPDWLDKELWEEFKRYRKERRSPLTSQAEKLALAKLDAMRQQESPATIIHRTIENGWKTFYPRNVVPAEKPYGAGAL